jgi:predicted DNA-binding protein (MmcQ/YjbR family)
MNIEEFRNFCLSFKGATENLPFDENTLVFKVMNKMFALVNIDEFDYTNLKCEPEKCVELRNEYDSITPGFHMNKKHWISVKTDGSIPDDLLKNLITNSYNLIVAKLTKKQKNELNNLTI